MAKQKTSTEILKDAQTDYNWSVYSGVASAISSIASGILGYKTAKTYGRMEQRAAETQARLNEIATERNIGYQTRQTQDQIADIKRQGRQVVGSQLAAMAATGSSTASGSMQALLKSTGHSVGRDISTLQANLINSAYEQRRATAIENIGLRYQGAMARQTANAQGFNAIATGMQGVLSAASSVASKWQRWQDLQMINQEAPTISPYSQALNLSATPLNKLDLNGYGQYISIPSTTGLLTDMTNSNSLLNQRVANLKFEGFANNKMPRMGWLIK